MFKEIAWIFTDGYVAAFALGAIFCNGVHMYLNTSQIRRNSETIRRNSEAIQRGRQ